MKKILVVLMLFMCVLSSAVDLPKERIFDLTDQAPIKIGSTAGHGEVPIIEGKKAYITDGTCDSYYYGYNNVKLNRIDGNPNHLIVTPVGGYNFADVPFNSQLTTLTVAQSRSIVIAKTDVMMEVWTANPINDNSIYTWFHIAISKDHAVMCRNELINELNGRVLPENIYVGPISLNSNLEGVCESFGINIVSVSQKGMCDKYNELRMPAFESLDIWYFQAHSDNVHERFSDPSYIGYIVTVGMGKNTGFNQGSYGPGIELFYNPGMSESASTPRVAGIFWKLYLDTGAELDEIREAVDNTCSFDRWQEDGGFGAINYYAARKWILDNNSPSAPIKKPLRDRPIYQPKDRARIDK